MKAFVLVWAAGAAFVPVAVAWATPPTPPIEVATTFKRGEAGAGILTIRATAHQSLTGVRLVITLPTALGVKVIEPRGRETEAREIDKDRMEYSVALAQRVERGTVSAAVELSARERNELNPSEVEVRVIGGTEGGGTAVGHVSLLIAVRNGRLDVESQSSGHPCVLLAIPQVAFLVGALGWFYSHKAKAQTGCP